MTVNLFNAQQARFQIYHVVNQKEFVDLKVDQKTFEKLIQTELMRNMAEHVMKRTTIVMTPVPDDENSFEFRGSGYLFTEKDFMNVLIEVCDLDNKGRDILKTACQNWLDTNS